MDNSINWAAMVETIKERIGEIEGAAAEGRIPPAVANEVKAVVDHCRTTLWGVIAGASSDAAEACSAIAAARLQRTGEMCQKIQEDVATGRIGADTPGVSTCYAFLVGAEKALRALPKTAPAAR